VGAAAFDEVTQDVIASTGAPFRKSRYIEEVTKIRRCHRGRVT